MTNNKKCNLIGFATVAVSVIFTVAISVIVLIDYNKIKEKSNKTENSTTGNMGINENKQLTFVESCFDNDIDYSGYDINKDYLIPTTSANQCQEKCQERSDCNFWTWDPTWNNACWMKVSKGPIKRKQYLVSGTKHCNQNENNRSSNYSKYRNIILRVSHQIQQFFYFRAYEM